MMGSILLQHVPAGQFGPSIRQRYFRSAEQTYESTKPAKHYIHMAYAEHPAPTLCPPCTRSY